MARSNFENLRVYQLAETLADELWELATRWNSFARDAIGKQIVRAADSVGANIAEGQGRGTYADNRRFVRMARGALNETKHFLRRAYRKKLLSSSKVERVKPLTDEFGPRVNAYLKSIGRTAVGDSTTDD